MDLKKERKRPSRRGKCFVLILVAFTCLVISLYIYAAGLTVNAHLESLILGAFLGVVNMTMFICVIAAAVLFMAELQDGD